MGGMHAEWNRMMNEGEPVGIRVSLVYVRTMTYGRDTAILMEFAGHYVPCSRSHGNPTLQVAASLSAFGA